MNNIIQRYYLPHKRKNETLEETIKRVDQNLIQESLNYQADRDTFKPERIDGYSNLDTRRGD